MRWNWMHHGGGGGQRGCRVRLQAGNVVVGRGGLAFVCPCGGDVCEVGEGTYDKIGKLARHVRQVHVRTEGGGHRGTQAAAVAVRARGMAHSHHWIAQCRMGRASRLQNCCCESGTRSRMEHQLELKDDQIQMLRQMTKSSAIEKVGVLQSKPGTRCDSCCADPAPLPLCCGVQALRLR